MRSPAAVSASGRPKVSDEDRFSDHPSPRLDEEGELSDIQSIGPDQEELLDVDQELSAEQTYRETLCGVRSFMGWNLVPEFDSSSSAQDDNPFAGTKSQQPGKVSVKAPMDDWLCHKFEKSNITVQEGYPSRASDSWISQGSVH